MRTAGDHQVRVPAADDLSRFTDGLARGCASGQTVGDRAPASEIFSQMVDHLCRLLLQDHFGIHTRGTVGPVACNIY